MASASKCPVAATAAIASESQRAGSHSRSRWDVPMNRQFIVAILLVAAVPVYAHAQNLKASKGGAQKIVTIISGDRAKIQTYCDIKKLAKQVDQAYEKKDDKMADELSQKIDVMEKTLGPEYAALIEGLQNDQLGAEFMSAVAFLNTLCTR